MAVNNFNFSTAGNYDASTGNVIASGAATSQTYASALASMVATNNLASSVFNISHTGSTAWTFVGGAGNDNAVGGSGADVLTGKDGDDTLDGAAGSDALWGGAGADTLIGGAGADTFKFGTTDGIDTIDTITTGDVINLYDMNYADVKGKVASAAAGVVSLDYDATTQLRVSGGYDGNLVTFKTKDGVTFRVGASAAALAYESGTKLVAIGSATNVGVTAAAQTAAVTIELADTAKYENLQVATGSDYNDYLRGAATDDTLNGGKGADNLWGGKNGGADSLVGGAGADTFWFGTADGIDTIASITTGDVINLYDMNYADVKDHFVSGAADSVSLAYDGTTKLIVDSGYDGNLATFKTKDGVTFRLGASAAILKYDSSAKMLGIATGANVGVTAAAQTAAVTIELADATKYENIKSATGSDYNDYLRGAATDDTLVGGKGADNLWGGKNGGADSLVGGAGADTFWFGTADGIDTIASITTGDVINLYDMNYADVKGNFVSGAADSVSLAYDGTTKLIVDSGYDGNLATFKTKDGVTFRLGASAAILKYDSSAKMLGIATGANVGVTAAAQTAAVTIELADATKYENIKSATGSDYNDYLRGAATNDTLLGGKGADNLWGGKNGGTDVMDGGGADNAADTFWFGIGDGTDTVQGYDKGDVVNLYNANFVDVTFGASGIVNLGAENVTLNAFTMDTNSNNVTFKTKDGVNFRLAHGSGAATAFTYADGIKFVGLVSGSANDGNTATVDASTSTAGVTIELGNTNQFVKVYTATGSNYNDYLRGSEAADKLTGGAGNDAIWGGLGTASDTLTGGIGSDTFWYGVGEGDDVITDGTSMDSVMIYNKDLDVSKVTANTFGTDLKLTFESGTLTVNNWTSAGLNTFNIGGTNYKFDSTTSALVKK